MIWLSSFKQGRSFGFSSILKQIQKNFVLESFLKFFPKLYFIFCISTSTNNTI